MKVLVFLLTAITFNLSAQPDQNVPELPKITGTRTRVNDFVPKGWTVLKSASGNLNNDTKADFAVILGLTKEEILKRNLDTFRNETPRILLILVTENLKFKMDAQSNTIILPSSGGGGFDPIEYLTPLTIDSKNKTLTLSMYGGLKVRWSVNYVFKKDKTGWMLLSAGTSSYDSTEPGSDLDNTTFDFKNKKIIDNKTHAIKPLKWNKPLKINELKPLENEIVPGIWI